jgi:phage terminase large subunit GpA-like protein
MMAVDHGGEDGVSESAYKFYRKMKKAGVANKVMLVKGGSNNQLDKVKKSLPDNTKRKDRKVKATGDVPLYLLSTNKLKDWANSLLEREEKGAGYVHFNDWLGEWFYKELTYEERGVDGKWIKPGSGANEAWDLFVYSLAVCVQIKADRMNWAHPTVWAKEWNENPNIIDPNDAPKGRISRPKRRTIRIN